MPRIPPPLLKLLSALSLLLAAATLALFIHSNFRYIYAWQVFNSPAYSAHWEFGSARGRIYVKRVTPAFPSYGILRGTGGGPGAGPAADWKWKPSLTFTDFSLAGFNWFYNSGARTGRSFTEI